MLRRAIWTKSSLTRVLRAPRVPFSAPGPTRGGALAGGAVRYNRVLARPAGNRQVLSAKVAELVDALALGASGATRKSSSLFFRTSYLRNDG